MSSIRFVIKFKRLFLGEERDESLWRFEGLKGQLNRDLMTCLPLSEVSDFIFAAERSTRTPARLTCCVERFVKFSQTIKFLLVDTRVILLSNDSTIKRNEIKRFFLFFHCIIRNLNFKWAVSRLFGVLEDDMTSHPSDLQLCSWIFHVNELDVQLVQFYILSNHLRGISEEENKVAS